MPHDEGYNLPFLEDWSSGSLETHQWTQENDFWSVSTETGHSAPAVKFYISDFSDDYFEPLTSDIFIADSFIEGTVHMEYEVKLQCSGSCGSNYLYPEYWDWDLQAWIIAGEKIKSVFGSFDWKVYTSWLQNAKGKSFRIRFVAEGMGQSGTISWFIDNIHVYRTCFAPQNLVTEINEDQNIELNWNTTIGCGEVSWLGFDTYWDGNSIGTGGSAVFDVAARWTPDMLVDYEGNTVSGIYFFPAETDAAYTVRVWQGDTATLMYEQAVPAPVINEWNFVPMADPISIDISQDLWVGYHVDANSGYPAGVDAGPAENGFGNMMKWQGQWKTLVEINPDLEFNWLIEALVVEDGPLYCNNRIYRKVNDGEYFRIGDIAMDNNFVDEDADLANLNCYRVTNVFAKDNDTCESFYSNEACIQPFSVSENASASTELNVYPIPADNDLFIEMTPGALDLKLFDMTGKMVLFINQPQSKLSLDVHTFHGGIYLLKISYDEDFLIRKVIVK